MSIDIKINIDFTPRQKKIVRAALVTGASIAGLGLGIAFAGPIDTAWIVGGQPVTASRLQGNLNGLQSQFTNWQSYYAEQTGGALLTSGTGNWIDLPGATVSFTTAQASTLDLLASGGVSTDATSGTPVCAFQFVLDGTSLGNSGYGNKLVQVAYTGNDDADFSAMKRVAGVAAGAHVVKLQMSRYGSDPGNCACGGLGQLAKLLATTRSP